MNNIFLLAVNYECFGSLQITKPVSPKSYACAQLTNTATYATFKSGLESAIKRMMVKIINVNYHLEKSIKPMQE